MKKLLATAGVALIMITPTAAYATPEAGEAVSCAIQSGQDMIPVPCKTEPVPLPTSSTYPPYTVEQKPPVEADASEAAVIMILSLLFGAAVITAGWCAGRF